MTEDEAQQIALEFARRRYALELDDDEVVIDQSQTQAARIGWVFWPESRIYLETERFDASLVGGRGIFVDRSSGAAMSIAGKTPTDFEIAGSPAPDWPTRAWLTIPLGFVAQVGIWFVAWLGLDLTLDALDITGLPIIVSLLSIAVLGVIGTGPTTLAVRWTGFANVDRRIPIALIVAGTVVGELLVSLYFIAAEAPGLDLGAAISVLPGFYAVQSFTYLTLKALVLVVMLGFGARVGDDEKHSKRLWRDD